MKKCVYRFGSFVLDQHVREVRCANGAQPLRGIPYRILEQLLDRRNRDVPKSVLLEQVWPGTQIVNDQTVRTQVAAVRKWLRVNGGSDQIRIPDGENNSVQLVVNCEVEISNAEDGKPLVAADALTASLDISPRQSMEALFHLFDEQLINTRHRRWPITYTPDRLAFLLNYFSLFFDKLYISANHILDNNLMPEVLEALNIREANSPIRDERLPFAILWDTSRFGEVSDFAQLLASLEADESYVTDRSHEAAVRTADLCDRYLRQQVVACDMDYRLDASETLMQLKAEVFNRDENHGLEPFTCDRLRECLDKLRTRANQYPDGAEFGIGRSSYYSVWGHGVGHFQKRREHEFGDIINEYRNLRTAFLTGVDYVSLSLKAKFASTALGRHIDVIMPKEYGTFVRRPEKTVLLELGQQPADDSTCGITRGIDLDPNAIINMTSQQLLMLHRSLEYMHYADQIDVLGNRAPREITEYHRRTTESAFNQYLQIIEAALKRHEAHPTMQVSGRVLMSNGSISTQLVRTSGTSPVSSGQPHAIELHGVSSRDTIPSQQMLVRARRKLQAHTIRLAREIKIYVPYP